jgi:hypothetical protein
MTGYGKYGGGGPAALEWHLSIYPFLWGIPILSLLSGALLLFLKIRSRLVFAGYTAFFVLVITAYTSFALTTLYVFCFWDAMYIHREIDRHEIIDHQHPGPVTLIIDEQLVWHASRRVFDYSVSNMGWLMEKERPDIADMFLDASFESRGWAELDMQNFSLADKEYVLTIMTKFRQKLDEKERIELEEDPFGIRGSTVRMLYRTTKERLAEFEDLLRQSIDRQRNRSLDTTIPANGSESPTVL